MKSTAKKRFIEVLAVLMMISVAVGGTLAYLTDNTEPLVNTFVPTDVTVDITDNIDGNVKDNVVIKNTGTTDAYIRARIVGSWVDEQGVTVQPWNPESDGTFEDLPGANWTLVGDYYYYILPVAPDGTTAPLFTSYTVTKTVEDADLVLDILVQAIQAGGGASQDAWGWTPEQPQ